MNTRQGNMIKGKFFKGILLATTFTVLSYTFLSYININKVYSAQVREPYSEKINNYLGYKEKIEQLKKQHPNWNFTLFYTGLDWSQVIKNETTAYHGRNVVPATKTSAWKCSICGDTPTGGSSWRCASEMAVSYYMDPRNWLNEEYIFQFENLAYNGEIQTVEGVQKIIAGIKYMGQGNVTYTKTDGTTATLSKSYAQIIMDAAKEAGISPYHLASRIRQEQGAGSTPGSTATGKYPGFVGYYNFLNIKASGSTDAEVIANGLNHAKANGWTDPETSIIAGAKLLAESYIKGGQNTIYLQKFDVDDSDGSLYWHQYMQNVSVCLTEGASAKKAYEQLGMLNSAIDFIIPIYENMPETNCEEPKEVGIVTKNVQITGTNVAIRNAPSTIATQIATLNTGDIILKIEEASITQGGYYWDKVVLSNGTKGYVARNYIIEIADVSNCNNTVIANTSVNLRNGPGLEGTAIITMLVKGQVLTRIETGKYNLNGYIWDRVKLADGRQGYVVQNYIEQTNNTGESPSTSTQLIKVICSSGLKVREKPGTNQKVLTYLDKGNVLTRTAQAVSNANGYTWDKIVTASGIEGYIARGDSKEQYIEVVSSNEGGNTTTTSKNDNFKIENTNLICEPATTVESIKEKYTDKDISVKKADGTVVSTGSIGTGYKITIASKTYVVIKMGDISGDGIIDARDSLRILKYAVGSYNINDEFACAADINGDGIIDARDSLRILKYAVGTFTINI